MSDGALGPYDQDSVSPVPGLKFNYDIVTASGNLFMTNFRLTVCKWRLPWAGRVARVGQDAHGAMIESPSPRD